MKEKRIEVPVGKKLDNVLGRIEEETLDEELERKKMGLTQEPEARREKRKFRPDQDDGKNKPETDYIKEWQRANPNYSFESINPEKTNIVNKTGTEVPTEFVDHLIGNAYIAMKAHPNLRERNPYVLGPIKEVRVEYVPKTKGTLIISLRDFEDHVSVLFFYTKPPFALKRVETLKGDYFF